MAQLHRHVKFWIMKHQTLNRKRLGYFLHFIVFFPSLFYVLIVLAYDRFPVTDFFQKSDKFRNNITTNHVIRKQPASATKVL